MSTPCWQAARHQNKSFPGFREETKKTFNFRLTSVAQKHLCLSFLLTKSQLKRRGKIILTNDPRLYRVMLQVKIHCLINFRESISNIFHQIPLGMLLEEAEGFPLRILHHRHHFLRKRKKKGRKTTEPYLDTRK